MTTEEYKHLKDSLICLTPYRELMGGKDKSIYDFVQEDYSVPDKVIAYLKTTKPYVMCPGVYKHPFKDHKNLLGPYFCWDGKKYYWDRDTWKYVVKYGLTLPQEFIDYVMSDEGTEYLEEFGRDNHSWGKVIENWKADSSALVMLPTDAGDIELDDF